ncbi:hypothetical protein FY528_18305 [Hymenobacter lutimineralis]|uniref:Uncharacterized protein n=1 Tax=Hymenobacter lutimineralis TaxID=2606448 RepID=A0A5D6UT91_9BACT|nr:hypothetical protein [Hymenobacter lutimineralis]TYZ06327.1 hypothetical protein FY528_18305 [Hymenobacter lutimineralis]
MNLDLSRTVSPTESSKASITALNSIVLYGLAFLLAYGVHQLATAAMAHRLGIPLTLHLSHVQFLIPDRQWWRIAVIAVYGVGPFLSLLLAIGAGLLFWFYGRGRKGRLKLFYFWLALHAFNLVLGGLIAGSFTQLGFWYVPRWLFVEGGTAFPIALAVLGGIIAVITGYKAAVAFLQSHDSRTMMLYANRGQLIFTGLLVPWVVGSLLLAALKWPDLTTYEGLLFVTMGLFLLPLSISSRNELFQDTVPTPRKTTIAWAFVGAFLLLALLWRLVFNAGITLS